MYDQKTLDANGGHTPECEGSCSPTCPIGQQRRRDANVRAAHAQAAWDKANAHDASIAAYVAPAAMTAPYYPTQADLARQRAEFVLDGAHDRPYHNLAHARVARGMPWNLNLGEPSAMRLARQRDLTSQVTGYPTDEAARVTWLYVSELPFLRTRQAGDGERWVQALRGGKAVAS